MHRTHQTTMTPKSSSPPKQQHAPSEFATTPPPFGSWRSRVSLIMGTLTAWYLWLEWSNRGMISTAFNEGNSKTNTYNSANHIRYNQPIQQISILGERNSGTRWTFDHINECFGHGIKVEKRLSRYKHWFQYEDPKLYKQDTLVIAQFRNPYDWFKAMERVPHHSPRHLRTALNATADNNDAQNDWKTFLTKEWTMERVGKDVGMPWNATCQENFLYRDIVSCHKEPLPQSFYNHTIRYSEHQPFYEMRNDYTGEPYANIMEMRTDKIRNFLSVKDYKGVADAWIVQYEYLLNKGTHQFVRRIQEWTGVEPRCKPIDAQIRKSKKSRIVSADFAKFVCLNLNWTVEAMINYDAELYREDPPNEW